MGRKFTNDSFSFEILDNTDISLSSGSIVTIGGQQYVTQTNLNLNTGVSGTVGGLDTGVIAPFSVYYLHVVISGGLLGVVASLSKVPYGYSQYGYTGWGFFTDDQSNVGILINSVNWQTMTYTPVGRTWINNVTYTGRMSREGRYGNFEIGLVLSGAQDAAELTLYLPAGLSVDTDAVPIPVTADNQTFGIGTGVFSGASIGPLYVLCSAGSTYFDTCYSNQGSFVSIGGAPLTNTEPVTWDNSANLTFRIRVPIDGWSANEF
jgi:hypothetical protein